MSPRVASTIDRVFIPSSKGYYTNDQIRSGHHKILKYCIINIFECYVCASDLSDILKIEALHMRDPT